MLGVYEDGDDGVVALLLAALDEAEMAGVQCAHGGNQADTFAASLLGANDALDLSGVCDDGGWFDGCRGGWQWFVVLKAQGVQPLGLVR